MEIYNIDLLNDINILFSIIILLFITIHYLIYSRYSRKVIVRRVIEKTIRKKSISDEKSQSTESKKIKPINNKKSFSLDENSQSFPDEDIKSEDIKSPENKIIKKFISNYSMPVETPYTISVSGGSGSGKSFITNLIANTIKQMFPTSTTFDKNVVILHLDNYYKGGNEDTNYDIPSAIDFPLFIQHLEELLLGNPIECPIYDFTTHSRIEDTKIIYPGKIIILEGILLLTNERIRQLSNLKIFVNASLSTQIFRRTNRDVNERDRTINEIATRYERDVEPSYHEHVFPSSRYADMFINNFNASYVGHEVMLNHIITILNKV